MKFIKTELAKLLEQTHTVNFTPCRATPGSAGYDLRAAIEAPITIYPDEVVKIPTGVKVWIGSDLTPENFNAEFALVGKLYPRSSTKGAILNNTIGICDQDYQGEIFVKLRNITTEPILIEVGEAFAQVIFTSVYLPPEMEEVSEFETITIRSEGGFGSTGK